MDIILAISMNIIIIWWAIITIFSIIALVYIIKILFKVNTILKDLYQKYNLITGLLFKPLNIITHFINKIQKNE